MTSGTGVFVLRDSETLVSMQTASFASENDFQRLLASFPELLAGDQIDATSPRRFVLVAREQAIADEEGGSGRWSLDHLFLDQDGIPTLVEVKRGTDTRIRREVVGQMLDYAANSILHWPVEELRLTFTTRCEAEGRDPAATLGFLIGPDGDADTFWAQVKTNLQAGRIRMLFVADRVPTELRRVVEFLNRQMQPAEVLAVELRQYEGQGLKTLVPIVLGQTQDAVQKRSAAAGPQPMRDWDRSSLLAAIAAGPNAETLPAATRIADWIDSQADRVQFNTNVSYGAMGALLRAGGEETNVLRLFSDGTMAVYFQYMLGKPVLGELALRQELYERLNAIPGITLPPDAITKRKTIPLKALDDQGVGAFLQVMDWLKARATAERTSSEVSMSPAS